MEINERPKRLVSVFMATNNTPSARWQFSAGKWGQNKNTRARDKQRGNLVFYTPRESTKLHKTPFTLCCSPSKAVWATTVWERLQLVGPLRQLPLLEFQTPFLQNRNALLVEEYFGRAISE